MDSRPVLGLAAAIALAGISLLAPEPAYGQQPSSVLVTVVDSGARYPLANADIVDLNTGQHRLTDENGETRMAWPSDGQLRLRVRQVKQGAEKYDQFRQHYPFEASIERRTAAIPREGDIKRILVKKETFRSESWEGKYKPGDIIQYLP